MKMQRLIGEARASTRSIFNIALIGALLAFAGHASGQAEELSKYCQWPADWDPETMGVQGFNELEAVDGNTYTIRFNGAIGDAPAVRTAFTFPAPLCDWNDDGEIDQSTDDEVDDSDAARRPAEFFLSSMTCGDDDDELAANGNLFGDSTTAVVNWRSDDGENTLAAPTRETPTEAVTCTLSLDWVGSNDLDGPITYEFKAAIVPLPHAAPATVRALAESYDSAYVEWTLVWYRYKF